MVGSVKDSRNQSYMDYSSRVMLGTVYCKSIAGVSSMQEMTRTFIDEKICRNLYRFMGENVKDYMPHDRKTFDNARLLKKWQAIK